MERENPDGPRAPVAASDHPTLTLGDPVRKAADTRPSTSTELDELYQLLAREGPARLRHQGVLARGGMGVIEIVVDAALERRLAMKRLAEKLESFPEAVAAFVREARITGQLDHPAVVPVHEIGVDGDGHIYFTMKIVAGRTLTSFLGGLPPAKLRGDVLADVLEIFLKVCDALAFAHSRGVLHCDIKPLNVMVGEFGQVYVMDWGLARRFDPQGRPGPSVEKPEDGPLGGTPSFMAPEQAREERLDERADVFAVGALLYFALTRQAPFQAKSTMRSLVLARHGSFVPVARLVGDRVPTRLLEIVERAMAKDREDRYSTMSELRDDLSRFLRGGVSFEKRLVRAGELLLREGDDGREAYLLTRGRAEAYRMVDGSKVSLGVMEAGEVIGEMALLISSKRTASVVAVEDCELMVVTEETLERELSGMQPWMAALTRTLAARFREREEQSAVPGQASD